jgi:hypothetical protein
MNFGQNHGSHTTMQVTRAAENPTDTLQRVLSENQQLQATNQTLQLQITEALQKIQEQKNELQQYTQFRQILNNPIDKFTIEIYDSELLRQIRGRMIELFQRGGHLDAEGHWVQGVVNERLQIVLRQLLIQGLKHWHRVKPQVQEIIQTQGLMR